jgi:hypothetical protein
MEAAHRGELDVVWAGLPLDLVAAAQLPVVAIAPLHMGVAHTAHALEVAGVSCWQACARLFSHVLIATVDWSQISVPVLCV